MGRCCCLSPKCRDGYPNGPAACYGDFPEEYVVEIADIAAVGGDDCPDLGGCAALNGTFVLDSYWLVPLVDPFILPASYIHCHQKNGDTERCIEEPGYPQYIFYYRVLLWWEWDNTAGNSRLRGFTSCWIRKPSGNPGEYTLMTAEWLSDPFTERLQPCTLTADVPLTLLGVTLTNGWGVETDWADSVACDFSAATFTVKA